MSQESPGGGEKTELPTQRKLDKSAKDGDVLQSRELSTALSVVAATLAFALFGGYLINSSAAIVSEGLQFDQGDVFEFNLASRIYMLLAPLALPFGGLFLFLMFAAIITPAALGSLGWCWSAIKPKPNKLNPLTGFKRMFGMNGLVELTKSIAKVLLIGAVGVAVIVAYLPEMAEMGKMDPRSSIAQMGKVFLITMMGMALCMVVIALIDVPMQIFQRNKRLMMSKQEIRDEHKETEGSPELKNAIRRRQQQILSRSVHKALDEATVVLMNPTHFAVVLRYDREQDAAPMVLARAVDASALAIRDLATDKDVPIMQHPELTRAIYFSSREGQMIDERLYMTIATLLAFIYRLNNNIDVGTGQPDLVVPDGLKFDKDGKLRKDSENER